MYPLVLAGKEQLATASAVSGNYDSTQSTTPIPVAQNAEPIWQSIQFRNKKCIQSDYSNPGLSFQHLVSHIMVNLASNVHSDLGSLLCIALQVTIVLRNSLLELDPEIEVTVKTFEEDQGIIGLGEDPFVSFLKGVVVPVGRSVCV